MHLNSNEHQLKLDCYIYINCYKWTPSDHKQKICNRYTKNTETTNITQKSSNHKRSEPEKNKELQKQPENNQQNDNKYISINRCF